MESVAIDNIKPNPRNPRVIRDEKFNKLKQSLLDFPDMLNKRPLVCVTDTDGAFVVLGGNMRLKAAKDIGMQMLPIILADEWTEAQRAEFLIKDNVGFGEWNWEDLANEWDAEKLDEWGLDVPGFDINNDDEHNDLSDNLETNYRIEVILSDEKTQELLYNELIERNYECRLLTL